MNVYFLVEGRRTEAKVYPKWLAHLAPRLTKIDGFDQAQSDAYFLFSAEGYPSILEVLVDAVREVNEADTYDYLAVCLDADECTPEERITEVRQALDDSPVSLNRAELVVITQNRCIETWFLGNRKVFSRQPQNPELVEYVNFYDVSRDDPEEMGVFPGFDGNHAQFHEAYLKAVFAERNITYKKNNPRHVIEQHYLDQLRARVADEPDHLRTFRKFVDFCRVLNPSSQAES